MAKKKSDKIAQAIECDNTEIWNDVCETPPAYGKQFTRPGGFKGTSIDPVWRIRRLTELFGPCGMGWGFLQEDQWSDGGSGKYVVYVRGHIWYLKDGERCETMSHTGGTVVMESNPDEAYKMAETDALGKCCLDLGIAADIYMGIHDTDKYQQTGAPAKYDGSEAGRRGAGNDPRGVMVPRQKKGGTPATPITESEVEGLITEITNLKDDPDAHAYSQKLFNRLLGSKDLAKKSLEALADRMLQKRCEVVITETLPNLTKTLKAYVKQEWISQDRATKMQSLAERKLGIPPETKE